MENKMEVVGQKAHESMDIELRKASPQKNDFILRRMVAYQKCVLELQEERGEQGDYSIGAIKQNDNEFMEEKK